MDEEPINTKPAEVPVYTPPENPTPPVLKQTDRQRTAKERLEIIKVNLSLASLLKEIKIPGASLNPDTTTGIEALTSLTPPQISEDKIALNMLTSAIHQATFFFGNNNITDQDVQRYTGLGKTDTIETYRQEHQKICDTWETNLQGAVPIFLEHVVHTAKQ